MAVTVGASEDDVECCCRANDVIPTAGASGDDVECCCMANEVAATAGSAEDDVECSSKLLMWQQQQDQQKMMWNVGAGF